VGDVAGGRIVGGQRGHREPEGVHRLHPLGGELDGGPGLVREPSVADEPLVLLVKLLAGRQLAVPEQERGLFKADLAGDLLDVVAPDGQDTLEPVDLAEGGSRGDDAFEAACCGIGRRLVVDCRSSGHRVVLQSLTSSRHNIVVHGSDRASPRQQPPGRPEPVRRAQGELRAGPGAITSPLSAEC